MGTFRLSVSQCLYQSSLYLLRKQFVAHKCPGRCVQNCSQKNIIIISFISAKPEMETPFISGNTFLLFLVNNAGVQQTEFNAFQRSALYFLYPLSHSIQFFLTTSCSNSEVLYLISSYSYIFLLLISKSDYIVVREKNCFKYF